MPPASHHAFALFADGSSSAAGMPTPTSLSSSAGSSCSYTLMPAINTASWTYSLCSCSNTGEFDSGEKPKHGMPSARRNRLSVPAGKISGVSVRPIPPNVSSMMAHQGLLSRSILVTWCFFGAFPHHGAWHQLTPPPPSSHHLSRMSLISSKGVSGATRMSKPASASFGITFRQYVLPPSALTPALSTVRLMVVTSPSFLAIAWLHPPLWPSRHSCCFLNSSALLATSINF
mmetsp:Transcript_28619/g.77024  ORF Transcript_28619/g.77024 Transcript_28619/m.77024 type:complete len:231 (+) Transcript_28619:204-896(+)